MATACHRRHRRRPEGFQDLHPAPLFATSTFDVNGPATVEAGTLFVNGRFNALAGFTVQPGARLGGAGLIVGYVTNRGTVNPGNSPGVLSINGDFTRKPTPARSKSKSPIPASSTASSSAGPPPSTAPSKPLTSGRSSRFGQQIPFLSADRIAGDFDSITLPDPRASAGAFFATMALALFSSPPPATSRSPRLKTNATSPAPE